MESWELDSLIDSLAAATESASERPQWRLIWDQIKRISTEFKSTRHPTRESRQVAWDRFQSVVEAVKQRQAEERREIESRTSSSAVKKEPILRAARDATPISAMAEDLIEIIGSMGLGPILKDMLGLKIDERLETLRNCSHRIKEGWGLFEENKRNMLGQDKAECFQALQSAQQSLDAAWQQWKSWQSEQRQQRIDHRREKREEFEGRVRSRIADLNERRNRLYDVLAHKERHLAELHERLDSARSDDFRERVSGWIDDESSSISDIRAKLDQIEGWIDEEKEKLR